MNGILLLALDAAWNEVRLCHPYAINPPDFGPRLALALVPIAFFEPSLNEGQKEALDAL